MRRAEERADDLATMLKANEEARKRAEKDAADVEDLHQRIQAAEDALSDKEAKQVEREIEISTRLETQSRRFSSNTIFPVVALLSLV
jgi:dsDNA-specific endonuclease/ATPase MutS2